MITLEEFISKARKKEENKVKITKLEVEDFGEIEFQRPAESVIFKFTSDLLSTTRGIDLKNDKSEKEDINISDFDIYSLTKISSAFVYDCCSMMREKKVRDLYPKSDFKDIPFLILGEDEVIRIATELNKIFKGEKTFKETSEDIKN